MATKKLDKAQLAQFKKDHAKLYKAGLVLKPARNQKPTRHALDTHKKFRNVLNGRDTVVTVPRGKAKQYAEKYETRGNKVAVPKQAGARVRYSAKDDDIVQTRKLGGVTSRQQLKPKTPTELQALEGSNITFAVPINAHHGYNWIREKTIAELAAHFQNGSLSNFKDWIKYVVVERSARARRQNRSDEGEA